MKKLLLFFLCLGIGSMYSPTAYAQLNTDFGDIYQILQTNCLGCHEGSSPQGRLDLSGTEEEVYNLLVEQDPTNPLAKERNYKLVDQGYPERSFLYRKVNGGLYKDIDLHSQEGGVMPPSNLEPLADYEKELIRQWIYFGAKKEEKFVNKNVIEEYYTEGGLDRIVPPAPPAVGEGIQLHLGSIFLEPEEEREYVLKYELGNEEAMEISKIEVIMNAQSHHFLFFKYDESADLPNEGEGLEEVTVISSLLGTAVALTNDTRMIGGWAYSNTFELPNGTAYLWPEDVALKFNYHIKNYSQTSILPCDVYVNIYTQPIGTALHEMKSDFRLFDPTDLIIPAGEERTFEWRLRGFDGANSTDPVNLWVLGAHTHQYGTDFDIYLRNADGSRGDQVYEGFYNFDYSFNQGYYDYGEPAVRTIDNFLTIQSSHGLLLEASYHNTSDETVRFGLTTADEMFGVFLQYVVGDISGITSTEDVTAPTPHQLRVAPNPFKEQANISYELEKAENVRLEVFNLVGQKVADLVNEQQGAGTYQYTFDTQKADLAKGVYMLKLSVGNESTTQKIVQY